MSSERNPYQGSKKGFFDDLYAIYDGKLGEDEDEGASFNLALAAPPGSDSEGSVRRRGRAKGSDSPIVVKLTSSPLAEMVNTRPIEAESTDGAVKTKHLPKLPEQLRFNFLDERKPKAPTRKRKIPAARPPTQKSDLFDGLYFYYVPNNLKNPGRRFKMQKADEHGAFCVNGWCPDAITHIVVDSGFKYADVLRGLKVDAIPEDIIVVKDTYPSDCLKYRRLVDHTQSIYTVEGREVPTPPVGVPVCSPLESPQIKLRADFVQETPRNSSHTPAQNSIDISNMPLISGLVGKGSSGAGSIRESSEPGGSATSAQYGDELEAVIADAKRLPFLEDENHVSSSKYVEDEDDSEAQSQESPRKKPRIASKKGSNWVFQCMEKNDGPAKETNPNQRTIQILSEMEDYHTRLQDQWRSISYRKAIATLRKQTKKICFASDAIELPNIGPRLAAKIEEIVQTDNLRRLEYAKLEPNDETLKLFLGVYGAGLKHAQQWVAKGHKTLQDLLDKEKLSASQRIGVERHADFAVRIPRDEVRQHGELIVEIAKEIDGDLQLQIMGSYRRGAKDCGDIDIMITKEDAETREMRGALDQLVTKLTEMGFLKCGLAKPHSVDDGSKWHGASQLNPQLPWRRIDFLIVPWAERGAALLYFTGSDIFNRSMRLLASKKGYRLNQRGLYKDVIRGPQRQKITEGAVVEGESEERIFKILGVPYRPPSDRNC